MFGSKKEVKKIKYSVRNFGILTISVICGILAFYGLVEDQFMIGAASIFVAVLFERHLEYDIYKKEDKS